jgi:exodeoxyribonuclease V alpha subunit
MRQAQESGILSDANKIRDGINPITSQEMAPQVVHGKAKDNTYIFRDEKGDLHDLAIAIYMKFVKNDDGNTDNVVIMTPTRNKKNMNSAESFSLRIQNKLLGHVNESINVMGDKYKLGAKVMHTRNDKEKDIYNGDIGHINFIGKTDDNKPYCTVDYGNKIGKRYYTQSEFQDLTLAYALSIHKLQGSGIKNTIIVFDDTHKIMLNNKLFYTAITRSKSKNIILSTKRAFKWGLSLDDSVRNTWPKLELDNWLKEKEEETKDES